MIVMKFGGSSLANVERLNLVAEIIKSNLDKKPIIVLSAMGKTTDNLLEAGNNALAGNVDVSKIVDLHKKTLKELGIENGEIKELLEKLEILLKEISMLKDLSPKTKDYLVSFGERLSVRIFSAMLNNMGIKAQFFDAFNIGFVSNSNFVNAELLDETYENIRNNLGPLKKNYEFIPVVTGFIAKDKEGNITTTGRGGSDLTASVIGASLGCKEIQVWKDVDGILSTDPRVVQNAKQVGSVSFEEASELAYFGAKVLHPMSILPVMKHNIPVRVKNSFNPDHPGTVILSQKDKSDSLLTAITFRRSVTLVDMVSTRMLGQYGFLAKVFNVFNDLKISVDMIATSEVSVSLTLDNGKGLEELEKRLGEIANINIRKNKTIVTLVGNVQRSTKILQKTFNALNSMNINVKMISQGASKVNISFIVNDDQANSVVKKIHKIFFE